MAPRRRRNCRLSQSGGRKWISEARFVRPSGVHAELYGFATAASIRCLIWLRYSPAFDRDYQPSILHGRDEMPLNFTGERSSSERFEVLLEAFDGEKRVVVATSTEALEDFGLAEVRARAEEKYDHGHLDSEGRVVVYTPDLKGRTV